MAKRKRGVGPAATPPATRLRVHHSWPRQYTPLSFLEFAAERQSVLEMRESGRPRDEWTSDVVLKRGRFCNIDRRDDVVTRELLQEWERRAASWGVRQKVLIATALRFTSSRRGAPAHLAELVDLGAAKRAPSPLVAALLDGAVACGTGTYQMVLNRAQVATRLEPMVDALLEHVERHGPFSDVASAGSFVEERMALRHTDKDARGRNLRPAFAAAETAKDLAYVGGLLADGAAARCTLGPGARKGLACVRAAGEPLPAGDEAAAHALLDAARGVPRLAFMRTIDVEQALCEYSKYVRYLEEGVGDHRAFAPAETTPAPRVSAQERCT